MTAIDDLELVLRLAILTDDRLPAEQRALLRIAMQVEYARNALVAGNKRPRFEPACRVVDDVLGSGINEDSTKMVNGEWVTKPLPGLKPAVLAKILRRRERWESPDEVILAVPEAGA